MAALLEEETAAYPELRRGEIIEGVVVGTDRDGILVDIGAKSEGVVPPHEMHCLQPEGSSRLHTGDKVLVFIVQPESPEGQIILSLDRARGERGWRVLQEYMDQNQSFEGYVTGSNKGGLLVNVEGVNAFVPLSQIVAGPERGSPENTQRALSEWVGRNITLKVIELNRRRNRAILSERAAVQEKRAADKERLLQELQEGDIKTGRVTSIRDFGIFVDIGGADGLVHLSELSWERTPKSPHELFKVGDEVSVYVLKVDGETKKIALSVRRAQPERWEEIVAGYREGQIVPGQITKLAPFGAFVRLEGPIEGLIHISELVDRRINHPNEVVEEGDVVPVKIVRIEYDRHRLGLSLRQARDKAEDEGWQFNERGGPIDVPQDALDKLGVTMPVRSAEPEGVEFADEPEEAAGETPEASAEPAMIEDAAQAAQAAEIAAGIAEPEAEQGVEAPAQVLDSPVEDAPTAEEDSSIAVPTAEPEAAAIAEPEAAAIAEAEATAQPDTVAPAVEEETGAPAVEEAEAPAAEASELAAGIGEPEAEQGVEAPAQVLDSPIEEAAGAGPDSQAEADTADIEAAMAAEPEPEATAQPEAEPSAETEAPAPEAEVHAPEAEATGAEAASPETAAPPEPAVQAEEAAAEEPEAKTEAIDTEPTTPEAGGEDVVDVGQAEEAETTAPDVTEEVSGALNNVEEE